MNLTKITNKYNLSETQINQFITYIDFLQKENKKYNLTNIIELDDIITYHLIDSLEITRTSLLENKNSIADIGSGCGVPGLLLAIFYPEKQFTLIEVTQKKVHFLEQAIILLKLANCEVSSDDFQTFTRKNKEKIETFIARASLPLGQMTQTLYHKDSLFKKSNLIYWGSSKWKTYDKHNSILKNNTLSITESPYALIDKEEIRNLNYVNIFLKNARKQ